MRPRTVYLSINLLYMNKYYVIPLTNILQNNNEAKQMVCDSLKTRGYVFIKLPDTLIKQIDNCLKQANMFFNCSQQYKKKFYKEPIFGHFAVNHKESFRVLTGNRLSEHKIPDNFNNVTSLVKTLDILMFSLTITLSDKLFPDILKSDLPLFDLGNQWGMFDIAKYYNNGAKKDINCKEHYDPGLLSLSLRSTEPGLELKNEHGQWIKIPKGDHIAVLWAGAAATKMNPEIKPGIHRVSLSGKPRIGLWYEVCTKAQEHKELINKRTVEKSALESSTGIPMSKSYPYQDRKWNQYNKKTMYMLHPFRPGASTGLISNTHY